MEELRQQLIEIISNSKLPAEGVYYIVKDVFRDVSDSYFDYLKQVKEQKEEEKNDSN